MPNWCQNNLTLAHDDPAEIQRAIAAFNRGELFQEFLPCPQELRDTVAGFSNDTDEQSALAAQQAANIEEHGYANWYDWCVANWGTKWDINSDGFEPEASEDGKSVFLSFSTAWAPPTEWYDNIEGFRITAYYYEPGVGFCGKWTSELGDEQHEFSMDDDIDELRERIPEDILDEFGIIDEIEWHREEFGEDDEENQDIDLDDGLSAINEGHDDEQATDGDDEK